MEASDDDMFSMALPSPRASKPAATTASSTAAASSDVTAGDDRFDVRRFEVEEPTKAVEPAEPTKADMLREVLSNARDAASRPAPPDSFAAMHPVDARRAREDLYRARKKEKLARRKQLAAEGSGSAASRDKNLKQEKRLPLPFIGKKKQGSKRKG